MVQGMFPLLEYFGDSVGNVIWGTGTRDILDGGDEAAASQNVRRPLTQNHVAERHFGR